MSQESDEIWLILRDTNGTNLLDTLYTSTPITASLGTSGSLSHFDRVVVQEGNESENAWKIDLENHSTNKKHLVFVDADTFLMELHSSKLDPSCDFKNYSARKLDWIEFQDSIFYSSGILTYRKM